MMIVMNYSGKNALYKSSSQSCEELCTNEYEKVILINRISEETNCRGRISNFNYKLTEMFVLQYNNYCIFCIAHIPKNKPTVLVECSGSEYIRNRSTQYFKAIYPAYCNIGFSIYSFYM